MLFVTVYIPVQSVSAAEAQSADNAGVYVFQDAKKEGTVTVIKKWEDGRTNDERPVPDITISTESLEMCHPLIHPMLRICSRCSTTVTSLRS